MTSTQLKFAGPIIGAVLIGGFGLAAVAHTRKSAKEVALINAFSNENIAIIQANTKLTIQERQHTFDRELASMKYGNPNFTEPINENLPSTIIGDVINSHNSPFKVPIRDNGAIDKVLPQVNTAVNDTGYVNSPLENNWFKDLINSITEMPFEALAGYTVIFGAITSLACILILAIYVRIYKLSGPIEDNFSGYLLKLVNFVKPYSGGFIIFYLSILVSTQAILLIFGLTLLSFK